MLNAFWAYPPVARTLTSVILVESIIVAAKLVSPVRFIFTWGHIFSYTPEIWRFASSFFLTFGWGIIFDPYFMWQYAGALEQNSPRLTKPGAFLVYVVFVGSVILMLAHNLLGAYIFTKPLILAIAYTHAQDNRGKNIKFIVLDMDIKWLPYAMLFLTFIMEGLPAAMQEATGLIAAHLYDMLTKYWVEFGGGRNIIPTPTFVARWFGGGSGGSRVTVKQHGTIYQPATGQTSSLSAGWGARGQGRRLGGN